MFSKVSNVITVFKAFCHKPELQGELMDTLRKKIVENSLNIVSIYSAVIDERHKVIETLSKLEETLGLIEERWSLHKADIASYNDSRIHNAIKRMVEESSDVDNTSIDRLDSAIDDVSPKRIMNIYKALDVKSLERRLNALQEQYEEIQAINGIPARDTEVLIKHHMRLVELVLIEKRSEFTQTEEYNNF